MQTIKVLVGLPGSGKSTWAKQQVLENKGKVKRVNKDILRDMLDGSHYTKGNETFVLKMRDYAVSLALRKDYETIIVDDTNFEPRHFDRMCEIAKHCNRNIIVETIYFDIPIEECVQRDLERPVGAGQVGEKVIRTFFNKYLKDKSFNTRTEIFKRNFKYNTLNIPETGYAVICDLDGTYAHIGDRSPFDASRCDFMDKINIAINKTLIAHHSTFQAQILFVSGRDEKDRESTERFINNHLKVNDAILPYKLFMRPNKDQREDSIVKIELYDKEIFGKYEVLFVADDRCAVTRAWRDVGLTVFSVNDVEF